MSLDSSAIDMHLSPILCVRMHVCMLNAVYDQSFSNIDLILLVWEHFPPHASIRSFFFCHL
jgi:hypothetical protein